MPLITAGPVQPDRRTEPRRRPASGWRLTGLIGSTAVVLLSACSGGSAAQDPQVASIQSPAGGAAATRSATAAADPRPQLRVDSSEEEHIRFQNAYASCLKQQGVPTYKKGQWMFANADSSDFPAAFKTCHSKQPRQPAAQDPARNPNYEQDNRHWIKCINQKSPVIKIRQTPDGWTYAKDYGPNEGDPDEFNRIPGK